MCTIIVLVISGTALGAEAPERLSRFGPDGTESTNFARVNGVAVDRQTGVVYVLDGNAGSLYKFTADGTPLAFTGSNPNIEGNKLTGLSETTGIRQVAVDSASHRVYVTEKAAIRAFEANGDAANFSAGPGAGSNAIPGFTQASGVAIDANGAIYASDSTAGTVSIYESTGALLTTTTVSEPRNAALAPSGAVYVVTASQGTRKLVPSQFPVTGATTYLDSSFIPPTAAMPGIGVDPLEGDVYVLRNLATTWIAQYDEEGNFVQDIARTNEEGELGSASRGLAVVGANVEFQLYASDTKTGEEAYSKVAIYGEEIVEEPPTIRETSASDVTSDSAMLHGEVNPNTAETTFRFEYGPEACDISTCESVPLGGGQIAAGHNFVPIAEQISGLEPDTTYHYRIVAENSFGTRVGSERTLKTETLNLGFQLADLRVWEMVSPADKHGARIAVPSLGGIVQASEDGGGLVYPTTRSIENDPQGNRAIEGSFVLSSRDASGRWASEDITPPHSEVTIITEPKSEYQLFSSDLGSAIAVPADGTLLSPQASERTIYLRENTDPPVYTPLLTSANVPPGTEFGSGNGGIRSAAYVLSATEDLSHIVLASDVPLISGAPANALYEWHAGQLHAVSKLPATEGGDWYENGENQNKVELGSGVGSVHKAVSADGSRVFWSSGAYSDAGVNLTALYLRDVKAEETVRLDVPLGGSGAGTARPVFQGANADGTVAFFTDERQLTEGASPAGRDLFRCEVPLGQSAGGCATLTDITPSPGPGESAEVLGLASGLGDDGETVSFVALGVLDSAPNSYGDSAVAGEPNLYRWHQGQGTRFIATLSDEDERDWGSGAAIFPEGIWLTAASSPSGRYFAFMSERNLTDQGNLDSVTGEPVQQVFIYDTQSDQLRCASCGFSGEKPQGQVLPDGRVSRVDPAGIWSSASGRLAAILPDASATGGQGGRFFSIYRPRAVLDNGRVFFNSVDSLVPGDSNGQWDVYEYEPTGTGGCTPSSKGPAIASSSFACVALLSSGTSEEEAAFFDASSSGNDVFFTTPAKLSVLDEDTIDDVYDARVNGVTAQKPVVNECQGEACQAQPQAPGAQTPASAAFQGAGNVATPRRCHKGKRRATRNGRTRCVPRKVKRQKHKNAARRAHHDGRAGR